jgi:hypothetical protein
LAVAGLGFLTWLLIPGEIDQKLAAVRSGKPRAGRQALLWLAQADPQDALRFKVTGALEPALLDGDAGGALDPGLLLRAYLRWADRDNVPTLIRMVENPTAPSWGPQQAGLVIEALGKLRDRRAAPAIAAKLGDSRLHDQAVNALKVIGPRAEKVVIEYLFDEDPDVRLRANHLVEEYGTKPEVIAGEALARLKSNLADDPRGAALWFADNPPEDGTTKAKVAKLLTGLLDDLSPKTNAAAVRALKLWATKESLPGLLVFARREQKAGLADPVLIDVLAQFPDARAAEAIALQLKNLSQRGKAVQALLKLGPAATGAVLGCVNHPDPGVRKEARSLARVLKVPADRLLTQTLTDIADPSAGRRRTALQYLAKLRPDPANRAKVARALNAPLVDPNADVRTGALNAVVVWGTKDNTSTLLKVLGDLPGTRPDLGPRVIDILASLHDSAAASVLAQGLTDFRARGVVGPALVAMGPAAEDAVIPFLRSADQGAQLAACGILAEIGTPKSLQPLKDAMDLSAWTSPFVKQALIASQKIRARE